MVDIHLSLGTQCSSNGCSYTDKALKKTSWSCRNFETFLAVEQQLTLYMYTFLSQVLRREKISFYVHFNTLINSRFSGRSNKTGETFKTTRLSTILSITTWVLFSTFCVLQHTTWQYDICQYNKLERYWIWAHFPNTK